MQTSTVVLCLLILGVVAYHAGKGRSLRLVGGLRGARQLHSLPGYYGALTALWCALPALFVLTLWSVMDGQVVIGMVVASMPASYQQMSPDELALVLNDVRNLVAGAIPIEFASPDVQAAATRLQSLQRLSNWSAAALSFSLALVLGGVALRRLSPTLRARNRVEWVIRAALVACATLAIFTTVGIVVSVLFESIRFFSLIPPWEFLFGLQWSPQLAIRADQVGSSGAFGAVPLFTGTLLIAGIAMLVAVPVGLFAAIYLAEYADRRVRGVIKPLLEVLAGIPTVVYGFFAALMVGPLLREWGESLSLDVSSESALAAGLVMGVMIIPFVSSLADDMLTAVPQSLRDGSLGLGATQSETIRRVVFPAALPGIVGGVLLAVSRAIGETMIVVMAAGLGANLTANPLEAVTTVTTQIVTLLVGDQEFDSPKTLAAFALGLVLFLVTLTLNIIALQVVRRYREQYE
jgi:phosphate transport system permease protein